MSTLADLGPRMAKHVEQLHHNVRVHCSTAQTHLIKAQTNLTNILQNANIPLKAVLYAILILITSTWLAITFIRRRRSCLTPPNTPNLEKRSPFRAPDRPPGGMSNQSIPSDHHLHLIPPRPSNFFTLTIHSVALLPLRPSNRHPLPLLVPHTYQTPPLPALPPWPKIQHHHGPPQHVLG
jgi:hypothetical protein